MQWLLKLVCSDCGARVTFRDEKPDWQTEGDQRFVVCPACGGKAESQARSPLLDLGLNKAFSAFRSKGSG